MFFTFKTAKYKYLIKILEIKISKNGKSKLHIQINN